MVEEELSASPRLLEPRRRCASESSISSSGGLVSSTRRVLRDTSLERLFGQAFDVFVFSSLPALHLCLKVGKGVRRQHAAALWTINTLWCVLKMESWPKLPSLLQVIIRQEAESQHFLCVFLLLKTNVHFWHHQIKLCPLGACCRARFHISISK